MSQERETLDLLVELSRDRSDFLIERAEHIDTVVVGVMALAGLALGVFSDFIIRSDSLQAGREFLWLAVGLFFLALVFSFWCLMTFGVKTGPHPNDLAEHYTGLAPEEAKRLLLKHMGTWVETNLTILGQKRMLYILAIVSTGLELTVLAAVLLS